MERAGEVNTIEELVKDEHIAGARDMFPTLHQEGVGDIRVTNIPVRFSKSGLVPLESAVELGANNEEVLTALGYTAEEIRTLRDEGAI
jgi:crotonobetainyl-CoA:carnitine CoA-transferase CaiB-like acyl-CoA transferase